MERSIDAIQYRVCILQISRQDYFWSEEEDEILRQYFPKEGRQTYLRLKNRSEQATYTHANALGLHITKHFWSEEEKEIIYKYYPIEGQQIISRLPNRSKDAITTQATKLGVKSNRKKSSVANGKKVYQYDKLTGDFLAEHKSAADATRMIGLLSKGTVSAVCRGEQKSTGGYYWSYIKADNYFDIEE